MLSKDNIKNLKDNVYIYVIQGSWVYVDAILEDFIFDYEEEIKRLKEELKKNEIS